MFLFFNSVYFARQRVCPILQLSCSRHLTCKSAQPAALLAFQWLIAGPPHWCGHLANLTLQINSARGTSSIRGSRSIREVPRAPLTLGIPAIHKSINSVRGSISVRDSSTRANSSTKGTSNNKVAWCQRCTKHQGQR